MNRPCSFSALLLGAFLVAGASAAEPAWLGATDCRIAPLSGASKASWKGACVDGYASGKGSLVWHTEAIGKHSAEATLARGAVQGEAILKTTQYTYTGTLKDGVPEGQGYFEYADDGGWYEGEVAAGLPHGKGIKLSFNRTRHTGVWANGKLNGWGEAIFAAGGSYAGGWKDNKFHGHGTITYAGSGRKYEGTFEDGRIAGTSQSDIEKGHYTIKVPETGSHLLREEVIASSPIDLPWDRLSESQKNYVRSFYPALAPGDEPPFPAKGQRQLFDTVRLLNDKLGVATGKLGVHVLVGKDGKPQSVKTIGAPSPELVRAVATLVMLLDYKPAMCQGVPCEMLYALQFNFSTDN
jgi:hypothetical protein